MDQIEGLVQGLHLGHHLLRSSRQASMALESCPASGLCAGISELKYTRIQCTRSYHPADKLYTIQYTIHYNKTKTKDIWSLTLRLNYKNVWTFLVIYPAMYSTAPSSDGMELVNCSSSISSSISSDGAPLSVTNLRRKKQNIVELVIYFFLPNSEATKGS